MTWQEQHRLATLRYRCACIDLEARFQRLRLQAKAGYRPDQPRVPAGNPDGGQWTDEAGDSGRTSSQTSEPVIPVAGSRGPRGTQTVRVGGRLVEATPRQITQLAISQSQMNAAVRAVRELDPKWRPRPQATATVDGLIAANIANRVEAEARLHQLRQQGIGYGRYAAERVPARSPRRNFSAAERAEINRIGKESACHTCGAREPGTPNGNFVADHQIPTGLNRSNARQSLIPHCLTCSLKQGGYVKDLKGK